LMSKSNQEGLKELL